VRPTCIVRLDARSFGDVPTVCQGMQIAAVVAAIAAAKRDLTWYAADVEVIGPPFVANRDSTPVRVGDAATVIEIAASLAQFESGVLAGVPVACANPEFRAGGLWTEDDESADLGDAVVEIRAFDTTYILICTNDDRVAEAMTQTRFDGGRSGEQ
jgi:hypothetical protein